MAVKVPRITALFWVIKVLTTAMGEATGDWLAGIDLVLTGAVGVTGFAIAMWLQFRADRYRPVVYWFAVMMVAVFGTMVADGAHVALGIPYTISTLAALRRWRWCSPCGGAPRARCPSTASSRVAARPGTG